MKSLFLGLATLALATSASATSIDRTKVVATVDGYYQNITSVTLLADGRLQVETIPESNNEKNVKTLVLPDVISQRLIQLANRVSGTEVETITREVVCMMIVMPETLGNLKVTKFDYDLRSYVGKPRTILTPRGCYMSSETFPTREYDLVDAHALREQLVVLALTQI